MLERDNLKKKKEKKEAFQQGSLRRFLQKDASTVMKM